MASWSRCTLNREDSARSSPMTPSSALARLTQASRTRSRRCSHFALRRAIDPRLHRRTCLMSRGGRRRQEPLALRALLASPVFLGEWLLAIFAWPIGRAVLIALPPPLPISGTFPEFELIDQRGPAVRSRSGAWARVGSWAVFDRHPGCGQDGRRAIAQPSSTARTTSAPPSKWSASRRSEHDTPCQSVRIHSRSSRASPRMWSFLTGDSAAWCEPWSVRRPGETSRPSASG